jgi:hypothetical protein
MSKKQIDVTGGPSGRKCAFVFEKREEKVVPPYRSVAFYDPVLISHCRLDGAPFVFRSLGNRPVGSLV